MGRWRGRSGASMALPTASRTEPPRPAIAALDSTSTAPPLLAFDVPRVRHTNASTGVLPQEARRAAHSCRRGRSETSQPRRRGEQTDASRNGTKCAQSRAAGQPAGGSTASLGFGSLEAKATDDRPHACEGVPGGCDSSGVARRFGPKGRFGQGPPIARQPLPGRAAADLTRFKPRPRLLGP